MFKASSLHTFPAGFGNGFAESYIEKYSNTEDVVIDPFAGGQSVAIHSLLLNRNAYAIDIDPISCLIGQVASRRYERNQLAELRQFIDAELDAVEVEFGEMQFSEQDTSPGRQLSSRTLRIHIPEKQEIEYWFTPKQRIALAVLMALVEKQVSKPLEDVLRLSISRAIIRKWPNTVSLARDIDHSRPHRTDHPDDSLSNYFSIFRQGLTKTLVAIDVLDQRRRETTGHMEVIQSQASDGLDQLRNECVSAELVLTSPPYFNAIDYPRSHKYSEWWLWPEKQSTARSEYIGLKGGGGGKEIAETARQHLSKKTWLAIENLAKAAPAKYLPFCKYVDDLYQVIQSMASVVKEDGHAIWVVANNVVKGIETPIDQLVVDLLHASALCVENVQTRTIDSTRRRYPFGRNGFTGLMKKEYVIVGRKPYAQPKLM